MCEITEEESMDLWVESLQGEVAKLKAEVVRLKAAIREHKDRRGDDRCWLDDSKLYSVLEDRGYDSSLPPKCEFLESCARFWEQRQTPEAKGRRAGEMTIAQLQAEVERLRERAEQAERALAMWIGVAVLQDGKGKVPKDLIRWAHGRMEPSGLDAIDRARLVIAGLDAAPAGEGGSE